MPRRPPTASSSSMKMIAGSCLRAIANSLRMRAAPRPANISTKAAADWAKNCAPDSCATALASSVLPVPGGPCSRIPLGTVAPSLRNCSGSRRNSTISCSSALASLTPAMSSHPTDWSEEGLICCGLTRGITFSIRHITKMIAVKNRIATTRLPLEGPVLDFLHDRGLRTLGDRVNDRHHVVDHRHPRVTHGCRRAASDVVA